MAASVLASLLQSAQAELGIHAATDRGRSQPCVRVRARHDLSQKRSVSATESATQYMVHIWSL